MKTVIVAVAGMSSRFNQDMAEPVLKGIYTEGDVRKTLLYSILRKCKGFDRVVLVGGYQYEKLVEYVSACKEDFPFQIQMVYNSNYQEFGTGYTLKLGLEQCLQDNSSEITLIEGDLFFDEASLDDVKRSTRSVATYNNKTIYSNKAVIAYINEAHELKYKFSTNHGSVEITEPFLAIYNSGQIWKFADTGVVRQLVSDSPETMWQGTNLKFIEEYFHQISEEERELLPLKTWENCNTKADYLKYKEQL